MTLGLSSSAIADAAIRPPLFAFLALLYQKIN